MPSPKRWFPCSRDLNDDPEVWELTETFGDRSLRIHLEVLAILDRCENRWRLSGQWLASLSRKVRQHPATVWRVIGWMVTNKWLIVEETAADGSPAVLIARNFWKYHRRRETEGSQAASSKGAGMDPLFPNFPYPNLPEPKIKRRLAVDIGDYGDNSEKRNGPVAGPDGGKGLSHVGTVVKSLGLGRTQ